MRELPRLPHAPPPPQQAQQQPLQGKRKGVRNSSGSKQQVQQPLPPAWQKGARYPHAAPPLALAMYARPLLPPCAKQVEQARVRPAMMCAVL